MIPVNYASYGCMHRIFINEIHYMGRDTLFAR